MVNKGDARNLFESAGFEMSKELEQLGEQASTQHSENVSAIRVISTPDQEKRWVVTWVL